MKIIAAIFEPKKMHIYDVKTTGRHPVHIIEGGDLITEDENIFDERSDLGWWYLNQKEYDYFKSQCKEIDIDGISLSKGQKTTLLENTSGYDLAKIFETTDINYLSEQKMLLKDSSMNGWKDLFVNGDLTTSFQTSFLKSLGIIK